MEENRTNKKSEARDVAWEMSRMLGVRIASNTMYLSENFIKTHDEEQLIVYESPMDGTINEKDVNSMEFKRFGNESKGLVLMTFNDGTKLIMGLVKEIDQMYDSYQNVRLN